MSRSHWLLCGSGLGCFKTIAQVLPYCYVRILWNAHEVAVLCFSSNVHV